MVGSSALFDTNILIDYPSGVEVARAEMDRYQGRSISIITWMEVMAGVKPEHEAETRVFLASFTILPITMATAERAMVLRRQPRMKLPDAMILASAELSDQLLITRNTRDFSTENPHVRIPYQL